MRHHIGSLLKTGFSLSEMLQGFGVFPHNIIEHRIGTEPCTFCQNPNPFLILPGFRQTLSILEKNFGWSFKKGYKSR